MLTFDDLESRLVPAGNVTAFLNYNTGLLTIVGDAAANQIRVISDGTLIRVIGDATTINGTTASFDSLASMVKSIDIATGFGNDSVTMTARAGNLLTGFRLTGNLSINTGDGADKVTMTAQNGRFTGGFEVPGILGIATGNGNDTVTLRAANTESNGFSGGVLGIATGAGADTVSLVAVNRDNSFSGFSGFAFGSLAVDTGAGIGSVKLDANNNGGFGFNLGGLSIQTGASNDSVQLLGRQLLGTAFQLRGNVNVNTSFGADLVAVTTRNAFSFSFDPRRVVLDGGSDSDRLVDPVFRGTLATIVNFESISIV